MSRKTLIVNGDSWTYGIHPSPHSHEMWAKELYNYIDRNNLL